jgi:MORN repeat variant
MKDFSKLYILALLICWGGCREAPQQPHDAFGAIPPITIAATDSSLTMQQGILYVAAKPFSGYVTEQYQSGKLASKSGYLAGKLEGKQEKWYDDGRKMEVRYYKENRKTGTHQGWWPNGQQKFEYIIENDIPIGVHREWHDNGQLYSLATYNATGQPEGKQQMWYATGQIKANYIIKDGRRFGFLGAKGCMGENEKKQTGFQNL